MQAEADKECDMWMKYGPDGCKAFIRRQDLNSLPVITMPYYPAIPFNERLQALPLIEAKLLEFAEKGLVYKDSDLRWRLFGQCWKKNPKSMEITLLDLGSMEKAGTDYRETINKQMAQLEERMGENQKLPL
jgi:hypothetical protein